MVDVTPLVDALVDAVGPGTGYSIDTHRLELFSQCPACRAADGGAAR